MSMSDVLSKSQAILDAAVTAGRVDAASFAIVRRGEPAAIVAGLANSQEKISATAETLFHIGSVTKTMTAELIWRLIAQGQFSLTTPLIEIAPEMAHIETLRDPEVTIERLLSHTSGLDGDVVFDAGRGKDVLRTYFTRIERIGSLSAAGAQFSYANIGYGILGRVVEIVGGAPFEDQLGKLLRETHGLSHVAISPEDKLRHQLAVAFSGDGKPVYFWPHSNIASGTVLAMSMSDLVKWASAHLAAAKDEKYAGDLPTRQMLAPAVALPWNYRYAGWGYGFTLLDDLGATVFGHDGGTANTSTFLRIAPRHDAVWAMSATGVGGLSVFREIDEIVRGHAEIPPVQRNVPGSAAPHDLSPYAGVYERHGMTFIVEAGTSALTLRVEGDFAPPAFSGTVLTPLSDRVFEVKIPAIGATTWISFHDFDSAGKPRLIFALERMAVRKTETHR